MSLYTVHVPDGTTDLVTRAERTIFVREGFNGWAFLAGPVFLIWHRLWTALLVWLVLAIAAGAALQFLDVAPAYLIVLVGLAHVFIGLEGNDLRRRALDHRGFRCLDIVSGSATDEAELAYFHRQPEELRPARPVPAQPLAPTGTPAVIGMFPDGSGR